MILLTDRWVILWIVFLKFVLFQKEKKMLWGLTVWKGKKHSEGSKEEKLFWGLLVQKRNFSYTSACSGRWGDTKLRLLERKSYRCPMNCCLVVSERDFSRVDFVLGVKAACAHSRLYIEENEMRKKWALCWAFHIWKRIPHVWVCSVCQGDMSKFAGGKNLRFSNVSSCWVQKGIPLVWRFVLVAEATRLVSESDSFGCLLSFNSKSVKCCVVLCHFCTFRLQHFRTKLPSMTFGLCIYNRHVIKK